MKNLAIKRFTKFKKADPLVCEKATATIHASAEEVLVWMWLYTSNHRMKAHQKKEGNLIRQIYKPLTTKANEEQVSTNESASEESSHSSQSASKGCSSSTVK